MKLFLVINFLSRAREIADRMAKGPNLIYSSIKEVLKKNRKYRRTIQLSALYAHCQLYKKFIAVKILLKVLLHSQKKQNQNGKENNI